MVSRLAGSAASTPASPEQSHAQLNSTCRAPTTQVTTSRRRMIILHYLHAFFLIVCRSALNETARKATKSKNTKGKPIKLPSKILAAAPDPHDDTQIYVAEAAGNIKRINIEVGQTCFLSASSTTMSLSHRAWLTAVTGR